MREQLIYSLLLALKGFSRTFYKYDVSWVNKTPQDPWANLRLVLLLNHTSLYEPLFAGWVPVRFLKYLSRYGIVPVADKTLHRPVVGRFFRMVAQNVVAVSRRRDDTWAQFVSAVKPGSMVVMAPEGRMKRPNGLDATGKPMTIRGGAADLLERLTSGRMLIAYSGGLHHVQFPSQLFPRLFKTLRMRVENLDISHYKEMLLMNHRGCNFKQALIRDLHVRMKRYCPSV